MKLFLARLTFCLLVAIAVPLATLGVIIFMLAKAVFEAMGIALTGLYITALAIGDILLGDLD